MDFKAAFDTMQYFRVDEGIVTRQLPLHLRIAILRELFGVKVDVYAAGSNSSHEIPIEKGGGQGRKQTPW
eukprot:3741681-Karenia_brevis.AAC.1